MTSQCDPGWYCKHASVSARPTNESQGGICPQGYYCPRGSTLTIPCDAGKYCPNQGMESSSGNCSAGYYCTGASKVSDPTDNITGNACPAGSYCPFGSETFTLCPPSTFSNATKNTKLGDCLNCTAGFFCAFNGMSIPSGECKAGYYCPGGQRRKDPPEYRCPIGNFCPNGSKLHQPCGNGFYQNELTQTDCKVRILFMTRAVDRYTISKIPK